MPKNAAMNENDTPCTMGNREPKVVCSSVATPLHSITDEISKLVCSSDIPIAGPNSRGTDTVEPNIVNTCCAASTTARGQGGRSSTP